VNPVARPTGRTPAGYDRDQAEAARQATLETMHTQLAEKVGSLDSLQARGSRLRSPRAERVGLGTWMGAK